MNWPFAARRRPLAVVFSGGASSGAFQVGVVDVLARAGIRPDLLVGTSVGALNAAYWAFHPEADAGELLLNVWRAVDRPTLWGVSHAISLVPRLMLRRPLFDAGRLESLLGDHFPSRARIEDAAIPLRVLATRASDGSRHAFDRGPLLDALLASAAIPGLFAPHSFEGEAYMDGGLVANCDLQAALDAGITQALVVDAISHQFASGSGDLADNLTRAVAFALARQTELMLATHQGVLRALVLHLNLADAIEVDDFSHTEELFELGRSAGQVALEAGVEASHNRLPSRSVFIPSEAIHLGT